MTAIEKVQYYLSQRELLEQLAEECAELGKASLKLIRASKMNSNYTPITEDEAMDNFREEMSDVLMCAMALNFDIPTEGEIADNPKWKRWAGRLDFSAHICVELEEKSDG